MKPLEAPIPQIPTFFTLPSTSQMASVEVDVET
jgi:hypothetical protein